MSVSRLLNVLGQGVWNLAATTLTLPNACVGNNQVNSGANIDADKLVHRVPLRYSQADGSAIADGEAMVHIFRGTTGTIVAVEVAIETAAAGDSTVDIDVELGNAASAFSSVLSSAIQITSSTVVRTPTAGTLSVTDATDGDILKITVDATVGTGTLPQGLVVTLVIDETPA